MIVSEETLLNYPDWTIPFKLHTDASDKELGAIISQNNKPTECLVEEFQKNNLITQK